MMVMMRTMRTMMMTLTTWQGVQRKERDIIEFTNRLGEEQASVSGIILIIIIVPIFIVIIVI